MHPSKLDQPIVLIVAAAGRGTRIRGRAGARPKPFLELAGEPILYRALGNLSRLGLMAVALVVRPGWIPKALEIATQALPGIASTSVEQESPTGTLKALRLGLRTLAEAGIDQAKPVVLFLHGDNVPAPAAAVRAAQLARETDLVLVSQRTERPGSSAQVLRDGGGVAFGLEKPESEWPAELTEVSTGLFAYGSWIWDGLEDVLRQLHPPPGEWSIDQLNAYLLEGGRAEVVIATETWIHINTSEDLAEAERALIRGGSGSHSI